MMINHIKAMLLFAAITLVFGGIALLAFYFPVGLGIVVGIIALVSLYLFCLEIV